MASPRRLNASTVSMMATPGKSDNQGALVRKLCPPDTMFPQVGVGGPIPSPRKLKLASVRIAAPSRKLARTMIGATMLGKA